jgi:hypothetical protein
MANHCWDKHRHQGCSFKTASRTVMNSIGRKTIAEALKDWSLSIPSPVNRRAAPRWWSFRFFGFDVPCYNFEWRQQALAHHDLHHVVTGYPCTLFGEMQIATWEFAAGRYPNAFATLFCLPLFALGALLIPRKAWSAFKYGRQCCSLFTTPITAELLATSVDDLRIRIVRDPRSTGKLWDAALFSLLVVQSALLCSLPIWIWVAVSL